MHIFVTVFLFNLVGADFSVYDYDFNSSDYKEEIRFSIAEVLETAIMWSADDLVFTENSRHELICKGHLPVKWRLQGEFVSKLTSK